MFTETRTSDSLSFSKFISVDIMISYLAHDVTQMQAIMGADVQRPLLPLQEKLGPESPQEKSLIREIGNCGRYRRADLSKSDSKQEEQLEEIEL